MNQKKTSQIYTQEWTVIQIQIILIVLDNSADVPENSPL